MGQVEGLKELQKNLDRLEKKTAQTGVKKAAREAQKIALAKARQNAKSMVGGYLGSSLAKDMKIKRKTSLKRGTVEEQIVIRPNPDYVHVSARGTRSYTPFAVEYGHAAPYDAGGVKIAKPIPFIRSAHYPTRKQREAKFVDVLKKEINKDVK